MKHITGTDESGWQMKMKLRRKYSGNDKMRRLVRVQKGRICCPVIGVRHLWGQFGDLSFTISIATGLTWNPWNNTKVNRKNQKHLSDFATGTIMKTNTDYGMADFVNSHQIYPVIVPILSVVTFSMNNRNWQGIFCVCGFDAISTAY